MQEPSSPTRLHVLTKIRERLPTGLAGAAFWLGLWFCALFSRHLYSGGFRTFLGVLQFFVGIALVSVAIPLAWQLIRKHLLWSLRNKLILTYLLIGLAPVILFLTLVGVLAYVAAGQFAIHLTDSRLQAELIQMRNETGHRADLTTALVAERPKDSGQQIGSEIQTIEQAGEVARLDVPRLRLHRVIRAFLNGAAVDIGPIRGKAPFGLPPWAIELPGGEFSGLVLDGRELYLVTLHQKKWADGRVFTLMSSLPVDSAVLKLISEGLGQASLLPQRAGRTANEISRENNAGTPAPPQKSRQKVRFAVGSDGIDAGSAWIVGGTEPPPVNVADTRVSFTSTEPITDWDTGERDNVLIAVSSRPSLLYNKVVGYGLGGIVTSVLRIAITLLCVVFALIELLALWMAIGLSRSITSSVADLYSATEHIDRGDFDYRIGVKSDDQLAELSSSFNTMSGSLQRLLEEQKEKERLQNEISIAQEVQANLFPLHAQGIATLDLHGVCRPARSVSGDYYDFLVFHEEAHSGMVNRRETGVGIAIGDISGKGISAALLMATLHSAVRAYRFASEELVYSESSVAGLTASREALAGDGGKLFESPGRILSMLNRHLYRTTQPEKYATLFLAHYDAMSAKLTYSNAGQLPPLVLSRNGQVRRLDKGGTVVGLMD